MFHTDLVNQKLRELSKMFVDAPEQTRIPIPELHNIYIFGNFGSEASFSEVAVDKAGRFWRHDRDADELVMFFDPSQINGHL